MLFSVRQCVSIKKTAFCLLIALACFISNHSPVYAETLQSLGHGATPNSYDTMWAGFNPTVEPLDIEILKIWQQQSVTLMIVRFRVGIFKGRKTMMAGIYGFPTGGTNLPGLIQLHGGGQAAHHNVPYTNALRGYASISLAWAGLITAPDYNVGLNEVQLFIKQQTFHPNYKVTTDWGTLDAYFPVTKYPENGNFRNTLAHHWTVDSAQSPRNNPWFFVAMAARRAVTFLQSQPQVNRDLIGMYGFSMGGKQTVMSAGVDERIKAAVASAGGVSDRTLGDAVYKSAISDPNALKSVDCPILLLVPANDFHAILDDVPKAIKEIPTETWRLAVTPHLNHGYKEEEEVTKALWMDQHLKGTFDFPNSPQVALGFNEGSNPHVVVTADSSRPIVSVDMYFTQQGRTRFETTLDTDHAKNRNWHHPKLTQLSDNVWIGDVHLSSTSKPLWAFATVTYDLDQPVSYSSAYFKTETSDRFTLAADPQIIIPEILQATKVTVTAKPTVQLETFEDDWTKTWYEYSGFPNSWGVSTHKVYDPIYRAPFGAKLRFRVLASQPAIKMVVFIDEYYAEVFLNSPGFSAPVELSHFHFRKADGTVLKSFHGIKELTLTPQAYLFPDPTKPQNFVTIGGWKGDDPVFQDLRWKVSDDANSGTWQTGYTPSQYTLGLWHFDEAEETVEWIKVGTGSVKINRISEGKFGDALHNTAVNTAGGKSDFILISDPTPDVVGDFFPSDDLDDPSLTVETWAMFTDLGAANENQMLASHWGDEGGWRLYLLKGREFLIATIRNSNSVMAVGASLSGLVANDEWHHYALTWDGPSKTAKIFVDGKPVTSKTDLEFGSIGNPGHDRVFLMGIGIWPLSGSLDEVRISSKAYKFDS